MPGVKIQSLASEVQEVLISSACELQMEGDPFSNAVCMSSKVLADCACRRIGMILASPGKQLY